MSSERFEWLRAIGAEVIATPGCESNVKEIYDKCKELSPDPQYVIFNQFSEFGNPLYHYHVTGPALADIFSAQKPEQGRLAAFISATGSAGTIAAGDFLKTLHPQLRIVAAEARQCPTLFLNGFGGHRIEGIGDKHVPWIHNVRNTDMVVAIDDEAAMSLMSLFNEPAGKRFLEARKVLPELVGKLDLLGISGIANLLAAIKAAMWYELDEHDILFTIFTDSMELYQSRLREAREQTGPYDEHRAELDFKVWLRGQKTDNMLELDQPARRRIHQLKYYTWVEQQKKDVADLYAQWRQWRTWWPERFGRADHYDGLIQRLNDLSGMAEKFI
jgi:cysteine synthase